MTASRYAYPAGFVLICAAVLTAELSVARLLPQATHPTALAVGLTLDLTVLLPAVYYVLLVRGRGWPAETTVLVFLAGLAAAAWVLPAEHRQFLHVVQWAAIPAELLVTGYVLAKAVRVVRRRLQGDTASSDVLERWRAAAREAFPVRTVAEVVAYEAAVWHYLVQGLRGTGRPGQGGSHFSYHAGYGAVVAVLLMLGVAELAAGHILLHLWSPAAAWIHFALAAYGLCWFVSDYFAACRRPLYIGEDALHVRLGLRWTVRISLEQIASVEHTRASGAEDALSVTLLGGAQVLVVLRTPVTVQGPYGLSRRVRALHLNVDEPGRFLGHLRRRIEGSGGAGGQPVAGGEG